MDGTDGGGGCSRRWMHGWSDADPPAQETSASPKNKTLSNDNGPAAEPHPLCMKSAQSASLSATRASSTPSPLARPCSGSAKFHPAQATTLINLPSKQQFPYRLGLTAYYSQHLCSSLMTRRTRGIVGARLDDDDDDDDGSPRWEQDSPPRPHLSRGCMHLHIIAPPHVSRQYESGNQPQSLCGRLYNFPRLPIQPLCFARVWPSWSAARLSIHFSVSCNAMPLTTISDTPTSQLHCSI